MKSAAFYTTLSPLFAFAPFLSSSSSMSSALVREGTFSSLLKGFEGPSSGERRRRIASSQGHVQFFGGELAIFVRQLYPRVWIRRLLYTRVRHFSQNRRVRASPPRTKTRGLPNLSLLASFIVTIQCRERLWRPILRLNWSSKSMPVGGERSILWSSCSY
jgi:hypothetical protein